MRAFYKSRLFWCGVPGLVFLLWVWWDSGRNWSRVEWLRRHEQHMTGVWYGEVYWDYLRYPNGRGGSDLLMKNRARILDDSGAKRHGIDFPRAFKWKVYPADHPRPEERQAHMALWVIVAGYVVVWLGAVFAWQRRKVRVMKALTESKMETEVAG